MVEIIFKFSSSSSLSLSRPQCPMDCPVVVVEEGVENSAQAGDEISARIGVGNSAGVGVGNSSLFFAEG